MSRRVLLSLIAVMSGLMMATTVRPVSLETMSTQATLVAEGRALSSLSQWNATHTMIVTYTRFQVSRALKGAASGEVTIRQPGGTVDVYRDIVYGVRYLKPGEEAALFLKESGDRDGSMVIVGLVQGLFHIERESSGAIFVSNGASGAEAQGNTGSVTSFRGTRISLSEFEKRVTQVAK